MDTGIGRRIGRQLNWPVRNASNYESIPAAMVIPSLVSEIERRSKDGSHRTFRGSHRESAAD